MGIVLFVIAVVLTVITVPLGMFYGTIKCILKLDLKGFFRKSNTYFRLLAVAIDQMGNVAMQDLFDDIFITAEGYKFGNVDETISSVLGKNERLNRLTALGKVVVKILDAIDPNHALNSIEENP